MSTNLKGHVGIITGAASGLGLTIALKLSALGVKLALIDKDEKGLQKIVAGVNTGRQEAYQHLLNSGFRTELQGVAMERPNEPGYNRAGIYLIDDWR